MGPSMAPRATGSHQGENGLALGGVPWQEDTKRDIFSVGVYFLSWKSPPGLGPVSSKALSIVRRTVLLLVHAAVGRPRLGQGPLPRNPQSLCACPQSAHREACSFAPLSPEPLRPGQPSCRALVRVGGADARVESTRDTVPVNTHLKLLQMSARRHEGPSGETKAGATWRGRAAG